MKRTLPFIMRKPRWDVKCRGCIHKAGLHLSSAALFRCQDVKRLGLLFLAWPPVCRLQHEVPLRRCEEAKSHPTGRLENGRLRLHQQFTTEGFAADRDENVAQEGLADEQQVPGHRAPGTLFWERECRCILVPRSRGTCHRLDAALMRSA